MYGLIGGEANAIEPSKRMLSSMTPTIIEKGGKLFMVVGTPGGSTIITSVFQTILNVIEFDKPIQEAVTVPRFHHQWLPDQIQVEKDFPRNTREKLIEMGYVIKERSNYGRTELLQITYSKKGKKISAVADKRGDDDARGY